MTNLLICLPSPLSNKGDAAIAECMLYNIKQTFPQAKISIICSNPTKENNYFSKYSSEIVGSLFTTCEQKLPNLFLRLEFFLKTLLYLCWIKLRFIPIDKHGKSILNLFENSDLLIFGGGGYLGGSYKSIQDILIPIFLAKRLNKKVYLSAITIEPPRKFFIRKLIQFILNRVDLITTREPISLKVLESLKIKTKKLVTADYALLFDNTAKKIDFDVPNFEMLKKNDIIKIGVSLKDWSSTLESVSLEVLPERFKQYKDIMTNSIETILEKTNSIIVLFPFDTSPISDDRKIFNLIRSNMKKTLTDRIFLVSENYDPQKLRLMIGNMDIFIATRFHAAIFAISMGIPTICIGYMQKNRGFMEMMGLKDWLLDFSSFTSEELVNLTLKLLKEQDIFQSVIAKKLPELQKNAMRNIELIKELL